MKTTRILIVICALGFATLAHAEPRLALRQGTRAFQEAHFTNAVALFETAAKEAPTAELDPSVAQLNQGAALFRDKQVDKAYDAFMAAQRTPDLAQQGLALYNAGVCRLTQFHDGLATGNGTNLEARLNESIDLFGKSLLVAPDRADTRHNLELALARRAALTAAFAELGNVLQNADQLLTSYNFEAAHDLLTKAHERLAPILKLGRPEAKTFEQYLERSGQIVEILHPTTNALPVDVR